MSQNPPDHLLIVTVTKTQSESLVKSLCQEDYHVTIIDSRDNILDEPTACLLIGFQGDDQQELLDLVRGCCHHYRKYIPAQGSLPGELVNLSMVEAQLGGAQVYLLKLDRFEQL